MPPYPDFTISSPLYGLMPRPRKKSCGADHPWDCAMRTRYRHPDTPRTGCPLFRRATLRRYHRSFAAGLLAALLLSGLAQARTAAEAQTLAERAVLYIHQVGREKAFADFSRPDGG